MGVVWSAWDPELNRGVALKLASAGDDDARAHARDEGRALARLSHPNVVPIYDVFEAPEGVFLVMELVKGKTLRTIVTDGAPVAELLRAYRQWLGRPLGVLHFYAHCDTWEGHFGEPSGHGTWVYEAIREGLVDPRAFAQIGLRSAGVRAAREYVRDQGGLIWPRRRFARRWSPSACSRVAVAP